MVHFLISELLFEINDWQSVLTFLLLNLLKQGLRSSCELIRRKDSIRFKRIKKIPSTFPQSSLNLPYLPYLPWTFPEPSLNLPLIFSESSLNLAWIFPIPSLYISTSSTSRAASSQLKQWMNWDIITQKIFVGVTCFKIRLSFFVLNSKRNIWIMINFLKAPYLHSAMSVVVVLVT